MLQPGLLPIDDIVRNMCVTKSSQRNRPVVMSFKAAAPVEYRNGFKKPRGLFPAATSSSLSIAMIEAKIGELQPKRKTRNQAQSRDDPGLKRLTRSIDSTGFALEDNFNIDALCGDVGESATTTVKKTAVSVTKLRKVSGDIIGYEDPRE